METKGNLYKQNRLYSFDENQ